jgi:protein-S-isoprenylcysteine O-methyltransferase Ste14
MTTLTSRRDPRAHPHRARRPLVSQVAHPFEHSPEVLLALSLVLVILAGPVAHALAPGSAAVALGSVLVLAAGIVLAVAGASRLLRS